MFSLINFSFIFRVTEDFPVFLGFMECQDQRLEKYGLLKFSNTIFCFKLKVLYVRYVL